MNEETIIQHLRSGDNNKALKQLYKAYPSIRTFIKKHGGSEEDAKDVFQDSLMVLYRNVSERNDFELTCKLSTYLYKVCKYIWKDKLKRKQKVVHVGTSMPLSIEDNELESLLEKERQFKQLDTVLMTIGKQCLNLLTLYYIKKKSMKEIASAMNYASVNSAKTSKYKCIEKARKMIVPA